MANAELANAAVAADQQTLAYRSHTRPRSLRGKQASGGLRRALQDCIDVRACEPRLATDTLSVAWLRGVFRHDARASQAAFRDYVSCLDDVYADERASGVPPPVHESSHGKCSHTPAAHRLSGCATHSKAMALSLPIHKLVWLCWSRASAARQASAQLRCEPPSLEVVWSSRL